MAQRAGPDPLLRSARPLRSRNRYRFSLLQLLTPPFRALAGLIARVVDIPARAAELVLARIYADIQLAGYVDTQKIRDVSVSGRAGQVHCARAAATNSRLWEADRERRRAVSPEVLSTSFSATQQSHASAHSCEATALHELQTTAQCPADRATAIAGRILIYATAISLEVHSCVSRNADGVTRYGIACDERGRHSAAKLG